MRVLWLRVNDARDRMLIIEKPFVRQMPVKFFRRVGGSGKSHSIILGLNEDIDSLYIHEALSRNIAWLASYWPTSRLLITCIISANLLAERIIRHQGAFSRAASEAKGFTTRRERTKEKGWEGRSVPCPSLIGI